LGENAGAEERRIGEAPIRGGNAESGKPRSGGERRIGGGRIGGRRNGAAVTPARRVRNGCVIAPCGTSVTQ